MYVFFPPYEILIRGIVDCILSMSVNDDLHDVEKGINSDLDDSCNDSSNSAVRPRVNDGYQIRNAPREEEERQQRNGSYYGPGGEKHGLQTSQDQRTTPDGFPLPASRVTTRSTVELPPPPDGGIKAWTQVAMGWLVLFTTWGYVNSFGSFQTHYTTTLSLPPSTVSWIGSIQVWFTFFIGAFSGRMLDAGLFMPTFLVGAALQVIGIFLMSISTKYWQLLLAQGVLTGLGGGIFFCPSLALIATYFSKHRGIALGIATTGNSAGGMIYPIVVQHLLPKLGFAWTARVLGFINLGCLVVVGSFLRPRLPPRRAGPIIDWTAFREPVYLCIVGALFFCMWALYYTFYYVSNTVSSHFTYSTIIPGA